MRRRTDDQLRALTMAWARTWDEISLDMVSALAELLVAGERIKTAELRRARRLQQALAIAAERIEALTAETQVLVTRDVRALVDAAGGAQTSIIDSQLPPGAVDLVQLDAWSRVDARQIDAIVNRTTQRIVSQTRPITHHAEQALRRELVRGVAVGANPRVTARRIVDRAGEGFAGGLSRALTVARTETLDAYRAAAALGQAQHADVLAGWMWLAELSSRTCPACLGQHGSVHPLSAAGPLGHQNCRCSRMPVTKPWSELGFPDLVEPPSLVPDADAFFAGLTPAEQQGILGKQGYQAWLAGKWPREKWAVRKSADEWRDSWVTAKPPRLATGAGGVRIPPPKGPIPGAFTGPGAPKPGRVTRAKGVSIDAHEVMSAYRLASMGLDVHFLANPGGRKTPDALVLGSRWEIKAPLGDSERTIRNRLRDAGRQADQAIFDLYRTALSAQDMTGQLARYWGDRRANNLPSLARVWVLPQNVMEHFIKERP